MAGNFESFDTLEEATKALTNTAQRAATLMRSEADRARQEASLAREEAERAWGQIESIREELLSAKSEIDAIRNTTFSAEAENGRIRAGSRFAWSAVGVMAVVMMVAVGWAASVMTRGSVQLSTLEQKLSEVTAIADGRATELSRLREEISSARIAQARAEGELRTVSFNARPVSNDLLYPQSYVKPTELQFNTVSPAPSASLKETLSSLMSPESPLMQGINEIASIDFVEAMEKINRNSSLVTVEEPTAVTEEPIRVTELSPQE